MGEAIEDIGEDLFDSNAPAVDVAKLVFQRKLRNQATEQRTQNECLQFTTTNRVARRSRE